MARNRMQGNKAGGRVWHKPKDIQGGRSVNSVEGEESGSLSEVGNVSSEPEGNMVE